MDENGLDRDDRQILLEALEKPLTVARLPGAAARVNRPRARSLETRGLATIEMHGAGTSKANRLVLTPEGERLARQLRAGSP